MVRMGMAGKYIYVLFLWKRGELSSVIIKNKDIMFQFKDKTAVI